MLRSSKAAMDNELKQVSQRPTEATAASQSSTSGSTNPSTTTTSHSSTGTTANKIYATLNKASKKFPQYQHQPDSSQPRKPEPPTRDLSSSTSQVAAISATPLTHVGMAQREFLHGHVHLTAADLLVHPQPAHLREGSIGGGVHALDIKSVGAGCGGGGVSTSTTSVSLYGLPVCHQTIAPSGSIVEAPEEWVLHTSCQGESNELLRECCVQSESRSDDSYPTHLSPSRNATVDGFHLQQGHMLQSGESGVGGNTAHGGSCENPNSSSMIFNIMTDPPTLSSPINPSHIAKAICPPPPPDSEVSSIAHPWSAESQSHHAPPQTGIGLTSINPSQSGLPTTPKADSQQKQQQQNWGKDMDLDLILPALESSKLWSSQQQQHPLSTTHPIPTSSSFCQLILAEQSVVVRDGMILLNDIIYQGLLVDHKLQGRDLTEEEKAEIVRGTEIAMIEDDVGGSIWIKVMRGITGEPEMLLEPSTPDINIFKSLALKFQGKIKISVYLNWCVSGCDRMFDFLSAEGMTIDPEAFTCTTDKITVGDNRHFTIVVNPPPKMHVKLVADIDFSILMGASFAQKVLEKEAFSDLIISAGNGAEINAHKSFLSTCSPVLDAMLRSGMEESQTNRVDMSDLSEEGVRALLRYIYHGDLPNPKGNMQVAYELFYAGHKYDVPSLEAEMKRLLLKTRNEDIDAEWAFKMYQFTKNIDTAVELKTKSLDILSVPINSLYVSSSSSNDGIGGFRLETEIETFSQATNDQDQDVSVAFRMYLFSRNILATVELKNKALRVLKAKWAELESLQEYLDLHKKPSNFKAAMELCRDLAMTDPF